MYERNICFVNGIFRFLKLLLVNDFNFIMALIVDILPLMVFFCRHQQLTVCQLVNRASR